MGHPPPGPPGGAGGEPARVTVRFLGPARQVTGCASCELEGSTVAEVLAAATARHGGALAGLLLRCQIWCNGEPVAPTHQVGRGDEVAVLPPVSGGSHDAPPTRSALATMRPPEKGGGPTA